MEKTIQNYLIDAESQEIQHNQNVIYHAKRLSDNKSVILKTSLAEYPPLKELAVLEHEYHLLKQIDIPEIIHAYDLIHYKNREYLVLEAFEGQVLKDFIRNNKVDLNTFYSIAIQLALILEKLHQAKIIHKDFNPSNILIDPKTLQMKLMDFSLSSELSFEVSSNLLEGTLPYISPEQTGRMNRFIDYRTDFYSLGITLYEILTGEPPFQSEDPLELIYFHLSKPPPPIPGVSSLLEALIRKLISKNAEDRYSSGFGIRSDLIRLSRNETDFVLGESDVKETFSVSQKLYGREEQLNQILTRFDEFLANGESHLLLVSGPSGMGKTALIQEVQKPLLKYKGIFIKGKYDILQKGAPYFGFIQAIKELIQYLLAQEDFDQIRLQIQEAIGPNGRVITSIVPEMEHILSDLPDLEPVSPKEAKNRLYSTFHNFFTVTSKQNHPLVIFLDDLQGVDQASLDLIQNLVETTPHLFFIGAYRDNEISTTHPLRLTLTEIKNKSNITVTPLTQKNVREMLQDTLESNYVDDLALLVNAKTSGNPFFITEFLKTLYEQRLLVYSDNQWKYTLKDIQKAEITNNVIDLMNQKIHRLSTPSREIICLAACIGGTFQLETLAIVSEKEKQATAQLLWEAIQEGLILTIGTEYKQAKLGENVQYRFLHDKVQEAAYQLISKDKANIHLKIARHLLEKQQLLFDILDQYNRALPLIQMESEKNQVAELNMQAAKNAKASNAYSAALSFIQSARTLVGEDDLEIEKKYAENLYLIGKFSESEKHLQGLLHKVKTKLDKLQIYSLLATQHTNLSNFRGAISNSLEGLKILGIHWPKNPNQFQLLWAYIRFKTVLFFKGKNSLKSRPFLPKSPQLIASERLMGELGTACFNSGHQRLFVYFLLESIIFGMRNGITTTTTAAQACYVILLNHFNRFKEAQFWQELTLTETSKFNLRTLDSKVYYMYGTYYAPWFFPIKESIEILNKVCKFSFEAGDFTYFGFGYITIAIYTLLLGRSLEDTNQALLKAVEACKRSRGAGFYEAMSVCQSLIESLKTPQEISETDLKSALDHPYSKTSKHILCSIYTFTSFLTQDFEKSSHFRNQTKLYAKGSKGLLLNLSDAYFSVLIACLHYSSLSRKEKKELYKNYKQMKIWAKQNPKNYLCQFLHLTAELKGVQGDTTEASLYYDRALETAEEGEMWLYAAIISESAFRFYQKGDHQKLARYYLQIAYYHYAHWGAVTKNKQLEKEHPGWFTASLSSPITASTPTSLSTAGHTLDFLSLLKSTQILSSEIVLEKLLDKMIRILRENAGAEKVILLIEKGDELIIEAQGLPNQEIEIYPSKSALEELLPLTVVKYVLRTQQPIVLHDASKQPGQFLREPYLIHHSIKSLLCTPILYQSKVLGILYLENNLASHAFTEERLQVLNVLSSQVAISLENARFYAASGRFVPNQFLTELGKRSIVDVNLGDQVPRAMTVLVCDIRNFTGISGTMSSKETFAFLNNFLGKMEPIIRKHRGFVDKYIGDAIMALFPDDPEDALDAAIEMLQHLPGTLKVGIGINTGELMLGILGGSERIESSVIGNTVNLAFRIEDLTKAYKTQLIITENTKQSLKNPSKYHLRCLGETLVKGKLEPITIWEVVTGDL